MCLRFSVLVLVVGTSIVLSVPLIQAEDKGKKPEEVTNARVGTDRQVRETEDKLNRLLKELRNTLPADAWAELKAVQAVWKNFKNKDCSWERRLFKDGSVAPLVYGHCLETHNLERIEKLKLFLCEGYGMTGPCEASEKYN